MTIAKISLYFILNVYVSWLDGTKSYSHSFYLQNSGILHTRMGTDPTKVNLENFQRRKWISQTVKKVDETNGVIYLVSFFPS